MEEIIENLRHKIVEFFKNDDSGHNIDHLERVMKLGLYLQSKEGGDRTVIAVSSFIHDVHRIMSDQYGKFVSPKESLPVVLNFISDIGLTQEQIDHVLLAVEHHEEYRFGRDGINVNDLESLILQDADNLDAIGAIGLVRTIKYGFVHDNPIYDPSVPLYQNEFKEGEMDASTIHHIHNKLIRLGEHMNTKTAKAMAIKRTKVLQDFIDNYLEELNI